jgi:PAS domain S-box-containing protein
MVVLKITCGSEVRRFSNVRPNCLHFQQFCVDLQKIFPQLGQSFQVQYTDDENEDVIIGNNIELQEAISMAESQERKCLRILVVRSRSGVSSLDFGLPNFMDNDDIAQLNLNMPQGLGTINYVAPRVDPTSENSQNEWDSINPDYYEDDDLLFEAPAQRTIPSHTKPSTKSQEDSDAPKSKHPRLMHKTPGGAAGAGQSVKLVPQTEPQADNKKEGSAPPTKLLRRRARNRVSARKSRMRKKLYHDSLQVANDVLTAENKALKERVKQLEKQQAETAMKINDINKKSVEEPSLGKGDIIQKEVQQNVTNLANSDLQLLSQVDFLNKSFCICDPKQIDNPIIYCSDTFVKLTGYPRSEILGRNCRFLQGPKTDARAVQVIRDAIKNGDDAEVKILNYRKDGTVFWNNFFIAALRDSEANIVHYVGVQQELKFPANMPTPQQSAKPVAESDSKLKKTTPSVKILQSITKTGVQGLQLTDDKQSIATLERRAVAKITAVIAN